MRSSALSTRSLSAFSISRYRSPERSSFSTVALFSRKAAGFSLTCESGCAMSSAAAGTAKSRATAKAAGASDFMGCFLSLVAGLAGCNGTAGGGGGSASAQPGPRVLRRRLHARQHEMRAHQVGPGFVTQFAALRDGHAMGLLEVGAHGL